MSHHCESQGAVILFAALFQKLTIRCASGQYLTEGCPALELAHFRHEDGHHVSAMQA